MFSKASAPFPNPITPTQHALNQMLFDEKEAQEIRRLVELGANPDAVDSNMRSVLGEALIYGLEEKAMLLLSLGASPDAYSQHVLNQTHLMISINKGLNPLLINELIKKSKNLDQKNQLAETALMLAIKKGVAPSIIIHLIEKTKDINAKNNQGLRALDLAILQCPPEQCSEIIKKLIEKGASLNLPNDNGNIPLLEAAYTCNFEVLKYVLETAPLLLTEQNNRGETALLATFARGHQPEACKIMAFLIKQGANPSHVNKEGNSGFMLAKKYPRMETELEKTVQELAKEPLNKPMFLGFFLSLSGIVNNKKHRLSSSAGLFLKRYLGFLKGLIGNHTPKSKAGLLAQLCCLQKQTDFAAPFANKILQDIMTGGEAHRMLLAEHPDVMDMFSRLENECVTPPQQLPLRMRTGKNFFDNDEGAYLFNKLDEFLKKEKIILDEDFAFILSDPRFWALPKETLRLLYDNQTQCKQLIKNWGLSYEQLRCLTQRKLGIFFIHETLLNELKEKKVPINEFLHFEEERLNLVLKYPKGLYALLKLGITFERLRTMDLTQLNLWLDNPEVLNFLLKHQLNLASIMTLESSKFELIAEQLPRLGALMALDIPFDLIIKLPFNKLCDLLAGDLLNQQAMERELLSMSTSITYTM